VTPLAALRLLCSVEVMPAEHGVDAWGRPVVALWWRLSPEIRTARDGVRIGVTGSGPDLAAATRALEADALRVLRGHRDRVAEEAEAAEQEGRREAAARGWARVRAIRGVVGAGEEKSTR
jgi:hypothetical protein